MIEKNKVDVRLFKEGYSFLAGECCKDLTKKIEKIFGCKKWEKTLMKK